MGNDIAYAGKVISTTGSIITVCVGVNGLEHVINVNVPPGSSSFIPVIGQEVEVRSLKISGHVQQRQREDREYTIYALVPNGSVVAQRHIGTVHGNELYAARQAGVT